MSQSPLEPEKYYHIYNHANGRENLFANEGNYAFFLKKYAEHLFPYLETYAYCLLPNHFHLLVRVRTEEQLLESYRLQQLSKSESQLSKSLKLLESSDLESSKIISKQFSNFFSAYTQAFNKQQNRKGSLFMPNFKRKEINSNEYLLRVVHYIHFNPLKHQLVKDIQDWAYTSYHSFLTEKPSKLARETVWDWYGNRQAFERYHQEMPLWEALDMD